MLISMQLKRVFTQIYPKKSLANFDLPDLATLVVRLITD